MTPLFTTRRFVTVLTATILTTYALIATGAAMTTTRAASSCSTWPFCGGLEVLSGEFFLIVGHRLLSVVAGVLVLLTLAMAWRTETSWHIRAAVTAGFVAFPIQVGVGALVVLTSVPYATQLHLGIATFIFVALLLSLGWALEGTTRDSRTVRSVAGQPANSPRVSEQASTRQSKAAEPGQPPANEPGQPPANEIRRQPASTEHSLLEAIQSRVQAYLELTKPRLMWLLCLLALAGIALAATTGTWPSGVTIVATLAGGVLAIGASGTFNHAFERDRDQRMARTADRPVATAQIPIRRALLFGVALLCLSMVVLLTLVNTLAAALTLIAVAYYSVLYTVVLKPNTSWNIALGGGAGALPAVIGWVAVTGSIGLPALVLALLVVIWTPAHFYNLAIVYREDYARGGYPMFPVVAGVAAARRRVLLTLGATLLTAATLTLVSPLGWLFTVAIVLAGSLFLASAVTQCRVRTDRATMRTFYTSNAYLGVVLLAIVAEALLI
ncbi:heme o synthase [Natronosalvus vescus]|uniref:heme o synthase n=1 Tax=Natronosalvus vescus TaxID=2953881 RepID=UPI002090DA20|nr:heme o synthase [Natronosalvus vescus]